jgi:Bacteriophage baseplate protein W
MQQNNYLKFPLQVDHKGQVGTRNQDEYIEGLIEQVLFTEKRSRVNRPDYGVGIRKKVFDTLSADVITSAHDLIQNQLQQTLGDLITVNNVSATEDDNQLLITIKYTINTSQTSAVSQFQRTKSTSAV